LGNLGIRSKEIRRRKFLIKVKGLSNKNKN
ncbi:unnamed protein product, partial [marine sediment metagenome]